MPTGTNQLERFRIIEECLKDTSKKYTKEALKEKVNSEMMRRRNPSGCVSFRTIGTDLSDMNRMLGNDNHIIPKRDGHETYYRYENDARTIFNTDLNEKELASLAEVVKTLSKFRGLAGYGWIDQTLVNLEWKFNFNKDRNDQDGVLSFDNNEAFQGREYIEKVIDAAVSRHALHIVYQPYGKEEKDWTIHPWHVKQFNNRWFLFGHVDEENRVCSCALDRIKSIERAMIQFKYNHKIDYKTFFNDVVGVTVPTVKDHPEQKVPAEEILLKLADKDFYYVTTKPLHSSQYIVDEDKKMIGLHLVINREFINRLLSLGAQVEVIKPLSLRATIKRIAEEMLKKYSDTSIA